MSPAAKISQTPTILQASQDVPSQCDATSQTKLGPSSFTQAPIRAKTTRLTCVLLHAGWLCNAGGRSRARIFTMEPAQSSLQPAGELEMGSGAGAAGGSCKALRWHPSEAEQLITVSESRLRRWSIRDSSVEVQAETHLGPNIPEP